MSFNLLGDLLKGIVLSLLYIAVAEDQIFTISSLVRYTMYYYLLNILFLNIDVNRDLLITVFVSKCISVILEDRMKQQISTNKDKNVKEEVKGELKRDVKDDKTEDYNSPTSNPTLSVMHQPATV